MARLIQSCKTKQNDAFKSNKWPLTVWLKLLQMHNILVKITYQKAVMKSLCKMQKCKQDKYLFKKQPQIGLNFDNNCVRAIDKKPTKNTKHGKNYIT